MKQILDDYAPILNVTPETKKLASTTPDKQPTELEEKETTSINTHSSKESKPEPTDASHKTNQNNSIWIPHLISPF